MRSAAALAVALLLTACASPIRTQPPIPSGADEITAAYLELVDASNAATCTFNAALSQSAPTLDGLKLASGDYVDSLGRLITGLRRLDWPAELGADASELIYALGINQDHAQEMHVAETFDAFIAADNQLIESNKVSAAAATQLRTDLGLGSAGDPCD